MTWARPVPVIGDATSAAARAGDPRAWALPQERRDALYEVVAARRDIRRFRPDPVPPDVLGRVLAAAHAAPSVGHSQPWRFIVVEDAEIRERAAVLTDRARHVQAAGLDPESARRLLDLQLEGVREAPCGVVVCCDRRAPAAGVLGRATFPDADLWSCACAIENLWLAARAEGLGLGWVTLFEPADLAGLLGLPEGVVTLGWLCLGWPDERPPAPGLERTGWSRRLPLDEVVFRDRWPAGARPAAPRSRLRAPDQRAVVSVRDEADRLLTPPGALGVLDRAVDRVLALGHPRPAAGSLLLAGADHPVCRHGVSAYGTSVTREVLAAAVAGEAAGTVAARTAGLAPCVVDAGVEGGPVPGAVGARPVGERGDLVGADALGPDDAAALVSRGRALGGRLARDGLVALGEVGTGNTTVAAALAAALLGLGPEEAVGLGSGADSRTVDRKRDVVGAALARARRAHGGRLRDPLVLLAALGGPEIAVLAGAALGAAAGGAAVVLDGLATGVAAALAVRLEPAVSAHLVAGQRSREGAHAPLLRHLGLEPLLDLRIRAGEGVGACLAAGLLQDAVALRASTARTSG
ncbi:5,6-dimethylbenzimidazole synthase [Streptomyces sp. NPDC047002]|uniref:5,6-dimethylbenzimidazole synthase n=1 Tax=Streptomyces sp. NPDC047002 TaxID=3155475 RepID=UPI0034513BAD